MVCDRCGVQEAIEEFVVNADSLGADMTVTVPAGRNGTGYQSEPYPEPTVSANLDSHKRSDSLDAIDNNIAADSVNTERATEGENQKKEKLKINILPTFEWYIVRVWTGREVETRGSEAQREVAG